MTSNYNSGRSNRCRNLVNLALSHENNGTENDGLGYEDSENFYPENSSPLPFGASEILENSDLRLLNEIIFNDDHSDLEEGYCYKESNIRIDISPENFLDIIPPENEGCNLESTYPPGCEVQKPVQSLTACHGDYLKDIGAMPASGGSTNTSHIDVSIDSSLQVLIPASPNNQASIQDQNDTVLPISPTCDVLSTCNPDNTFPNASDNAIIIGETTPMPSPEGSTMYYGEEEAIPSVSSRPYSSDEPCSPCTPISTKKRKYTKKKDRGRLREQHEHEWIDSKRKRLKNSGRAYSSRDGKQRQEKSIGKSCGSTCKLKCFDKLDEDTRRSIFKKFWAIGDHSRQYDFIIKNVVKISKKTVTRRESRRTFTYIYHLPWEENNHNSKLIVCKTMFLNTLSCGAKMIRTALNKSTSKNDFSLLDNRGRHSQHRTLIDEEMKKSVCDHVRSFEPVSSHYCRKDSDKLYLDEGLSFSRMYNLYKEWFDHAKYGTKCESLRLYRDIVNRNINMSFHRPKKDQCHLCHSFKNGPVTEELKKNYETHIKNKNQARVLKDVDKREAQNNSNILCATYDLQKVLLSPHGEVSLFYYCKRLKVHNLSVFDIGHLQGTCYLWTEQIAMKGSNEIASCVHDIILMKAVDGCDDFRFWSDNCTGQNRNRIMFFMYLYTAKTRKVNIKHTFLEKGHTQNEGDSIHATIEKAAKFKYIYTPSEWSSLIRWAKVKGTPYKVIDVEQNMIFDFKKMQTNAFYNWTKNSTGDKIQWTKIKQVRACKDEDYVLFYKYDLSDDAPEYRINITTTSVRTRRAAVSRPVETLDLCYNNLLPIAQSKKKDLLDLCRKNIIPQAHHSFYEGLVVANDSNNVNVSDESD